MAEQNEIQLFGFIMKVSAENEAPLWVMGTEFFEYETAKKAFEAAREAVRPFLRRGGNVEDRNEIEVLLDQAKNEVERLKREGWTTKDFAAALKQFLSEESAEEPVGDPKPFKVQFLWGSNPEPDQEPSQYEFATLAELNAFLEGVSEANGWLECHQIDPRPDGTWPKPGDEDWDGPEIEADPEAEADSTMQAKPHCEVCGCDLHEDGTCPEQCQAAG